MGTVQIETQTLQALIQQARVAPPRDYEARCAIDDAAAILDRIPVPPSPGQGTLFPASVA